MTRSDTASAALPCHRVPRRTARRLALGLVAPLLLGAAVSAVRAEGLDVTYVGNSGFLVAAGETKVLIDGLFREGVEGYATIPEKVLGKAEQAQPPFDGVDLVLATHYHADHFDAAAVTRHLAANPQATFISTPQAVDRLRATVENFETFAPRVRAELPAEGKTIEIPVGDIRVRVLNLHHGRDSDVQNIGFVVTLGGETFTHFGDTQASYQEIGAHRLFLEPIDIAFVGYWDLQSGTRRRVYHDNVGADRIVAMHLPVAGAPSSYFGDAASLDEAIAEIHRAMPDVVVFREPLETKHILPPDDDKEG
jgi:L-ascorbate metabolism protein UlaG (beta-lactamase superfamily)